MTPARSAPIEYALVHVAVEELEPVGHLVIGLADHRYDEQEDEPEVEERVHHPGGGVTEQRLHPDAAPEVAQAALGVLAVRAPVVGTATLVVADA